MPTIQWKIESENEVESTNILALKRARMGESEGLVIRALSQTNGRGRMGRKWFSPPGSGLYFSALLRPPVATDQTALISLIAGVAAAEGIADITRSSVGLKWPNDLRLGGKKTGGILCEYESAGGPSPAIVVGIGINLKIPPNGFPEEFGKRATSIEETGTTVDGGETLHAILERLDYWYRGFLEDGFGDIRSRWEALCDNLGERIHLSAAGKSIEGKMVGIDHSGHMLLELPTGEVREFESGEVVEG